MGFENDDMKNLGQPTVVNEEVSMMPKITYTTDFLMSLRELDICKQLPNGFDKSILNEFHDACHGSQEKTRTSGCFVAQNIRRTEYGASPPTWRDVNSNTRGSTGKSESCSREGDSQTERDSDSGRQIGNHSRRPWQNSEHDGLLGSGSSPKLIGYTSETSAPKFRSNDQPNLSRSNAPYQPPRLYKAVPHNRITTNDLHNDETFGCAEITSEDKAEEERKRRAEFELMRKERCKSDQQKRFLSSVDSKTDLIFDAVGDNESLKSSAILAPRNGSIKSSTTVHTSASRPVVPPGFGNTNTVAKSAIKHDIKVLTSKIDDTLVYSAVKLLSERKTDEENVKQTDDPPHRDQSNHSTVAELLLNGEGPDSKMGVLQSSAVAPNHDFATPFSEDVFGNSLTTNGGGLSSLTEQSDANQHDKWKGSTMGSSKFAHWFAEEDGKRQRDCQLSEMPTNLFSLIGGGPTSKRTSDDAKAAKANDTSVTVLTCEDLEQSILSELSHHDVPSETRQTGSVGHDPNITQPKAGTDLASQHLLSVLHKGPAPKVMAPSLNMNKGSSNQNNLFKSSSIVISTDSLKQRKVDKISDMGKNPTLETLFGSAFMKELQVTDAPISTKNLLVSDSSRFRLPEDENFITGSDPLNTSRSFHGHVDASMNAGNASSHLLVGNTDRQGALTAMFRDGRAGQDNQAFPYNPHEKMEHSSAYYNIHPRSSPPQFPPPHMNQGRPMFNQSDAQRQVPQLRFSDNMIHRDQPLTQQFSPSRQMFHQLRPMGFDPASQQMMQQAHMQSNAVSPHILRQYSGNLPQSSHPYNQVHGFRQELDSMQCFHVGHQQPDFGGLGMSPTVSDIDLSSQHPGTLQHLMDMELRSKAKERYPIPGHPGGLPNF